MADEIEGGSGSADDAAKAAADAAAKAAANEPKTFTQDQLNKIIEERLGKTKKQLEDAVKFAEELKKNKSLGDEQQAELTNQISSLQRTLMSKEELTAKEKKELQNQLTKKVDELEKEKAEWKLRYETSTVERAIFDEVREVAFDPQQFIDFLGPRTKLLPEVVEGKSTGRYLPTVQFIGQDADGKSTPMELSVKDTVKEMQKLTGKYGNLFKSGLNSGLGGTNAGGIGTYLKDSDIKTHEDYMKSRDKIKEARLP